MAFLDRVNKAIIIGKGTKANIIKNTTYAEDQGEIGMATDENRVYIGDSSYRFQDLLNFVAPHIVTNNDEVVINSGEIVWLA